MKRFHGVALAGLLVGLAAPALAGPPPTVQTIKDQAFASDGFARAIGKLDPDTSRAPIDAGSWERIDTEVRAVSVVETDGKGNRVVPDPNERPQYLVVTYKAKSDLYVEVANIMKTSIIRPIIKAGETTVIVADVTPKQVNGNWSLQVEWRNRLPGGQPRESFPNAVLRDSPEDAALQERAKRAQDEAMAKSLAEAEKQAAYNRQADEARKVALANIAKQNADDVTTLHGTLEPLVGKWIPYTRIEYRSDSEPESDYRALKIDRLAENKGVLTLLLGNEVSSPRAQVPFTIENGSFNFRDENCTVGIRPARDSGRVYMLYGNRDCPSLKQQVAIIPEERDLAMLDLRKAPGVTMIRDGKGARPLSPRVDGTKLESLADQSPESAERTKNAPRYEIGGARSPR